MKTSTSKEKDKLIERLRGPITYDVMEELGRRNEARVKKLIAEMGTKWIGHPARHVERKVEGSAV